MEPGSVSNLSSRNINNPVNRQRTAESRENKSDTSGSVSEDVFEPSSELVAASGGQGTETAEAAKPAKAVNAAGEKRDPIQDQDEAAAVVKATAEQILGDITGASSAQGNLDGDSVLGLTA